MEARMDFLNWLDPDMSVEILTCLEDPADLLRFSSVSRFYRHFVIANGLCKKLCLRMFPELSRVARVDELKCGVKESGEVGSSYSMEWEALERDHRVYASLAQGCTSFVVQYCISEAISASSTDNYPDESIDNTLKPGVIVERRASYWSSKGQSNPEVPETLLYKLVSDICVITEINIRPFEAFFQLHSPIYSAKSVRFRMGHPKSPMDVANGLKGDSSPGSADDKFIWTYTSEQFPMAQESHLQKFKLPEPVLCIGGFLQIELLGRVQRQEADGLFYICMSHVQAVGRSLSPAFSVEILDPTGNFVLKNDLLFELHAEPSLTEIVPTEHFVTNYRQIVNMLYGNDVEEYGVENVEEYGEYLLSEEDEEDEEYRE